MGAEWRSSELTTASARTAMSAGARGVGRRVAATMDPIGRKLNPEEAAILTVLGQEGRTAHDRTAPGVAIALERDPIDVAGALDRLKRDGLTTSEVNGSGEECWSAAADPRSL